MNAYNKFASVVLDLSIGKTLDYGIPDNLLEKIQPGTRVCVPVRGHKKQGYVFEVKEQCSFPKVLPVFDIIGEQTIPQDLFDLAAWMANYYCVPINKALKIMVPSSIRKDVKHKQQLFVMRAQTKDTIKDLCVDLRKKSPGQAHILDVMLQVKKGILLSDLLEQAKSSRSPVDTLVKKGVLSLDIVRIDRSPLIGQEYFKTTPKKLNEEQQEAFAKILNTLDNNTFHTHLLHGVTGSGKTEIYLQSIEKALAQDKGTIMLVPEISLTAQTTERFRSRFEGNLAILHHRLSDGERYDEWCRIRGGRAKIVIGARSAIFSPVQNLGLIIVDEEHEGSYKQTDEMPCYNARDMAVMRGSMTGSCVILGSATPSLESYFNAQNGKYTLSELHLRAESSRIPDVKIVDMRLEFQKNKGFTNFSDALIQAMKKRLARGEQTILFLNRRGYHTTLLCQKCQHVVKCRHCDIALTFHNKDRSLACHLCGFSCTPPPARCPECKSENPMKFKGVGTELIEKSLNALLPGIRTIRMDADTTRHKGSHQKLLREFGSGKADVLIGTQMIAKGLHFPQVTLVGVINSDASLNIPDFRASETVFQVLTQVAGRAGREALKGEVIIQTCMPDNQTLKLAKEQDFKRFYQDEIETRKMFGFPPHTKMVKLKFAGKDKRKTEEKAGQVRNTLTKLLSKEYNLHPVMPSGYAKVKDKYLYQFFVRGPSALLVAQAIKNSIPFQSEPKMTVDIDPTSFFF